MISVRTNQALHGLNLYEFGPDFIFMIHRLANLSKLL